MIARYVSLTLLFALGSARAEEPAAPRTRRPRHHAAASTSLLPRKTTAPGTATKNPSASTPGPVSLRQAPLAHGTVLSIASGRAYVDAGAKDGLAPGQKLTLLRRGTAAATCTVEAVSERSATCAGPGGALTARAGDTFALSPPPAPAEPAPAPLPPPLSSEETRRRLALVSTAPVAQVEWRGAPATALPGRAYRAEARLLHASWFAGGSSALHQERLDVRVDGAPVAGSFRLYLDASGVYRGSSADGARFRPGDSATLEVRELALASRGVDSPLAVAFGRVRPWFAPGSSPFDGAQVGLRAGDAEVGLFGGLVPDPLTTGITTDRSTAGAYASMERADEDLLLHAEARGAMVRSPELGSRVETEVLAHAWLGRTVDLNGDARLGFGDHTAPSSVDFARLDLSARLAPPVWISGGVRYVGLYTPDPTAPALFPNPARHLDLAVAWDALPSLTVRGTFGYAKDLTTGLDRRYGGPEVVLPRLLGWATVSAGWLEEGGWAAGRMVWAQAQAQTLAERLRVLGRGAYYVDARPEGQSSVKTVGAVLSAAYAASDLVAVTLTGTGRLQVDPSTEAGPTQGGLSVLAGLEGRY